MTDQQTTLTTLAISILGALAWLPQIISFVKVQKLHGKVISRYDNYNLQHTFFLFRLSVLFTSRDFHLKEVRCTIDLQGSKRLQAKAANMRKIVFDGNHELRVEGRQFLNNCSVIRHDTNTEGYLFFEFSVVDPEMRIEKTTFTFVGFNGKSKRLVFMESGIDPLDLFYDDSIWAKV